MTNEEARNIVRRVVAEIQNLEDSSFNCDNRDNLRQARRLMEDVGVWNYED